MMAKLIVQHDKTNVRDMAGMERVIRAANTIGKATKKIESEAARYQAESQGGIIIVVAITATTISLGDAFTP
jgi:hypothetical protein